MPQTSGSCSAFSGTNGLLQALIDFCCADAGPGRDWTLELDQNSKGSDGITDAFPEDNLREVILKNTGLSGNEQILIGIREWKYVAGNAWGWDLNGYLDVPSSWAGNKNDTGFTSYNSTWKHWASGTTSGLPILQLFDSTMYYWIYSTKERIVVIVKVGSSYFACYLGLGYRLGSPSEYPFPLLVAGSWFGNRSYQAGGYGPVRPIAGSFFVVSPGNLFRTGSTPTVIPMQGDSDNMAIDVAPNGKGLLLPCYVLADGDLLMSLQGVYAPRMLSMQSEDLYEAAEGDFRIFQQAAETYNYSFMAVQEETEETTTTEDATTTTEEETTTTEEETTTSGE